MKPKSNKIRNHELSFVKFCDLGSSEESKLRLIANLLLQTSESLSPSDAAEVGHQIRRFLEKKILLEHLILGRSVPQHWMSKEQFLSEIALLKEVISSEIPWS
jgi:hypothetical protein